MDAPTTVATTSITTAAATHAFETSSLATVTATMEQDASIVAIDGSSILTASGIYVTTAMANSTPSHVVDKSGSAGNDGNTDDLLLYMNPSFALYGCLAVILPLMCAIVGGVVLRRLWMRLKNVPLFGDRDSHIHPFNEKESRFHCRTGGSCRPMSGEELLERDPSADSKTILLQPSSLMAASGRQSFARDGRSGGAIGGSMHDFPAGSDIVGYALGNYYGNNHYMQQQQQPQQHNRSTGFCTRQENGSRSTHSITVLMEDSRLVVEIEEQSREEILVIEHSGDVNDRQQQQNSFCEIKEGPVDCEAGGGGENTSQSKCAAGKQQCRTADGNACQQNHSNGLDDTCHNHHRRQRQLPQYLLINEQEQNPPRLSGLSQSDQSVSSCGEANLMSYSYGNQLEYEGGFYGYSYAETAGLRRPKRTYPHPTGRFSISSSNFLGVAPVASRMPRLSLPFVSCSPPITNKNISDESPPMDHPSSPTTSISPPDGSATKYLANSTTVAAAKFNEERCRRGSNRNGNGLSCTGNSLPDLSDSPFCSSA